MRTIMTSWNRSMEITLGRRKYVLLIGRIYSSEHGPDSPEGVSGASDCSGPRSGADNRAALAAKRPIPPRVAGRNSSHHDGAASAPSVDGVVGGPNP